MSSTIKAITVAAIFLALSMEGHAASAPVTDITPLNYAPLNAGPSTATADVNVQEKTDFYPDLTPLLSTTQNNLTTSQDMSVQSVSPVPEPAAFPMMAIGVLIVWRAARRKRNAKFKV
ncbi:MAG: PEP-CTERM sorting domain-containing protein [Burkholderiaceae bacterium]